jgi:hypothetical protein
MNTNFIKSVELEKKFHNRTQKDLQRDEEYLQYKEDEQNTLKMATILRSLNEPKRKRIEQKRQEFEQHQFKKTPKNYTVNKSGTISPQSMAVRND